MRILVTGCAGFIGYHLTQKLIENGHNVMGIDNLNDYYDVRLKLDRLKELGIDSDTALHQNKTVASDSFKGFKFVRMSIEDRENLPQLFNHNHLMSFAIWPRKQEYVTALKTQKLMWIAILWVF